MFGMSCDHHFDTFPQSKLQAGVRSNNMGIPGQIAIKARECPFLKSLIVNVCYRHTYIHKDKILMFY
jgi:hypothetical protein